MPQYFHLEFPVQARDNRDMSTSPNPLFESALALPQEERADLAFQLLQTLTPPAEEISSAELADELRERVEAHRRGEQKSFTPDEAREIVAKRLSQDRQK